MTAHPPATVRAAGFIVAAQGIAALVVAAVLVVRALDGADQHVVSGYGTAVWFALVGGGVLTAGATLVAGRRWGRGLAVFAQLLLLPIAWYLGVGSQRPLFGIPLAAVALTALGLLFSPASLRWAAGQDPASSDKAAPDTR